MNCISVRDTIVEWLTNYLKKSNQLGYIIGISGGVDSALVSTLCALTEEPTMVLSLPIHQSKDQLQRATNHINWLKEKFFKVDSEQIDLTQTFETFKLSFYGSVQSDELAMANLRSRIRMCTLYAYAGHFKCLVAGTGNSIEDKGIGFCTKYGDSGVDLSPIGDLSKSQVWELAAFLGINEEIVQAKPTDGLWADNRGDEDAIGATYAELEWAMAECETEKINMVKINDFESRVFTKNYTERQKQILNIFIQRHVLNRHKFDPIPVCMIPKVIL